MSPQNRKEVSFRFLSASYTFTSDSGVFSKDGLDTGTRILLEILVKQNLAGKCLDYGCGIGTIGILLKVHMDHLDISGFDINQRAVELAKLNARKNHVEVDFYHDDKIRQGQYDVIILNPPIRSGKKNIYRMFKESYDHLVDGGQFWIVIRKSHGALSAIKELQNYFKNVEVVNKDKGFFIVASSK